MDRKVKLTADIMAAIEADTSKLRGVYALRAHDSLLTIGDSLEPSRDMDLEDALSDGEEYYLDGTSTIGLGSDEVDPACIDRILSYGKPFIYLVKGEAVRYGDDEREVILYRPEVLAYLGEYEYQY